MFRFIEREKAPVRTASRALGVSESGYHAWRTRPKSERALGDEVLGSIITRIHGESRRTYGAPRVHAELRLALGIRVGRKRDAVFHDVLLIRFWLVPAAGRGVLRWHDVPKVPKRSTGLAPPAS